MLARLAFLAIAATAAGCYDVPRPACGFVCGPAGECPSGYTCNSADDRCHLDGSPPSMVCPGNDGGLDLVPPEVVLRDPEPGAADVDGFTLITVVFSEDITGLSNQSLQVFAGGSFVTGILTYDNTTFTAQFDPTLALPSLATVDVTLTADIEDRAGNALTPSTWSFTTVADVSGPSLAARAPEGTAGAPVTVDVVAIFNEDVIGVSDTTFTLSLGATPVAATVTYDAPSRTATLDPQTQLAEGASYTATLTSGITDTSLNPLEGAPISWSFTIGADDVRPVIVSTTPVDMDSGVATSSTISVLFDEPVTGVDATSFTVNGGAITGTLTSAMGGRMWTFTPDAPLPAASAISVTLSTAITDTATTPNALAAPFAFGFTTL